MEKKKQKKKRLLKFIQNLIKLIINVDVQPYNVYDLPSNVSFVFELK